MTFFRHPLLAMPSPRAADMCSECQAPAGWHTYALSLRLWPALNLASVPADRGSQPSSACKFVLVGLVNRAGQVYRADHGIHAWRSPVRRRIE
jgi:hypothetical protein